MLQHYGVKPYFVFDGAHLPSKAGTEKERATYVGGNTVQSENGTVCLT